jgi:hypothetical protein
MLIPPWTVWEEMTGTLRARLSVLLRTARQPGSGVLFHQ